jgi:hypothetical protein
VVEYLQDDQRSLNLDDAADQQLSTDQQHELQQQKSTPPSSSGARHIDEWGQEDANPI